MSVFVSAHYASTSITAEYTASADQIIDKFTATNVTGSSATFKVYIGGITASELIYEVTIAANTSDLCHPVVGQDLASGEIVYCIAGTGSAIVIRAGGRSR